MRYRVPQSAFDEFAEHREDRTGTGEIQPFDTKTTFASAQNPGDPNSTGCSIIRFMSLSTKNWKRIE